MVLYVIRHLKTEFNKESRITGHLDSKLIDNDVSHILHYLGGIRITGIISSDLNRAKQTAHLIADCLPYDLNIDYLPALREINYGSFSGIAKKFIRDNYHMCKYDPNFRYPDGESFMEMYERAILAIRQYENLDGNYLIITHSGVIRAIHSYFRNMSFEHDINAIIPQDIVIKCYLDSNQKRRIMILH